MRHKARGTRHKTYLPETVANRHNQRDCLTPPICLEVTSRLLPLSTSDFGLFKPPSSLSPCLSSAARATNSRLTRPRSGSKRLLSNVPRPRANQSRNLAPARPLREPRHRVRLPFTVRRPSPRLSATPVIRLILHRLTKSDLIGSARRALSPPRHGPPRASV